MCAQVTVPPTLIVGRTETVMNLRTTANAVMDGQAPHARRAPIVARIQLMSTVARMGLAMTASVNARADGVVITVSGIPVRLACQMKSAQDVAPV